MRYEPVAATAAPLLLASAPVDAIACPANRAARGDLPEAQGAGPTPAGWAALLPIGHQASLAAPEPLAGKPTWTPLCTYVVHNAVQVPQSAG